MFSVHMTCIADQKMLWLVGADEELPCGPNNVTQCLWTHMEFPKV